MKISNINYLLLKILETISVMESFFLFYIRVIIKFYNMKKIYFLLGTLCVTLTSIAQPTLTSTDLNPTIGEAMAMIQGNYIYEGNGGNNVTWDLSATTNNMAYNLTASAATGTTPNANVDMNYGGQSDMYFLNNAAGQQIHYQYASSTMITFSDPMQMLTFPLSMSTNYTDNFAATFTSGGYAFDRQGTVEVVADGYGTLKTPSGTYSNVLRVTITQTYSDTYTMGIIDYDVTSVVWYKAGYHNALASCVTLTTFQGTNQYTEYMAPGHAGIQELNVNSSMVYPNPVENKLFVNSGESEITNYELFNLMGELTYSSTESLTVTKEINMSSLNQGIYILKLTHADNSIETRRVVKN